MTPEEMAAETSGVLVTIGTEIDAAYFCPRRSSDLDRVLLALTSKALTLAKAVCQLVKGGFYGESLGLSRSSVEAFLLVKFISNKNAEKRASSYLNFFKAHVYNTEQLRRKHYSRMKRPAGLRKQWIEDAETIPNKRSWESAWNMASEFYDDPREASLRTGQPYQALFEYEGIYEYASHYVHCGVISLIPHLTPNTEVSAKLQKKILSLLKKGNAVLPKDRIISGKLRSTRRK